MRAGAWNLVGVLLVVCGALAWIVAAEVRRGADPVPAGAKVPAEPTVAIPEVPVDSYSPPPLTHYAEIIERPLFMDTRRPLPPEEAKTEQAAQPAANQGEFHLTGVVIIADQRVALLRENQGGEVKRVEQGETIGGWSVETIGPESVTLRHDETVQEVKLIREAPAQAASPRPPQAVRRPVPRQPFRLRRR